MTDTYEDILDVAQQMVQSHGYNGFSFRNLATKVGIKSASVHYHFPSKGDLGAAIARRYTDRLMQTLGSPVSEVSSVGEFIKRYVSVFRATLAQDGQMCLCGMLAAERDTVPAEVQIEVIRFVELNVEWLTSVLSGSKYKGTTSQMRARARAIFAALEGAMLVSRGTADMAAFDLMCAEFTLVDLLPSSL